MVTYLRDANTESPQSDKSLGDIFSASVLPSGGKELLVTSYGCVEDVSRSYQVDGHVESHQEYLMQTGLGLANVSLLQALLLAPQGPVDPAHKQAVKLEYCNLEVRGIPNMNMAKHIDFFEVFGDSINAQSHFHFSTNF